MTPTDSPVGWVAKHIGGYVESEGSTRPSLVGVTTLFITTRGRSTGIQRRTALIYGHDGDNYVVVASNGGKNYQPNWYLNLRQDPDVEVQVGAELLAARARTATGRERTRLWQQMAQIWPDYERHQRRTSREIPAVVLERR